MCEGRITGELGAAPTQEQVMTYATQRQTAVLRNTAPAT
jgi:hypothetical protein